MGKPTCLGFDAVLQQSPTTELPRPIRDAQSLMLRARIVTKYNMSDPSGDRTRACQADVLTTTLPHLPACFDADSVGVCMHDASVKIHVIT